MWSMKYLPGYVWLKPSEEIQQRNASLFFSRHEALGSMEQFFCNNISEKYNWHPTATKYHQAQPSTATHLGVGEEDPKPLTWSGSNKEMTPSMKKSQIQSISRILTSWFNISSKKLRHRYRMDFPQKPLPTWWCTQCASTTRQGRET